MMRLAPRNLFTIFVIAFLVAAVVVSSSWTLRASIVILVLGSVGVVLATAQLLIDIFGAAPAGPKRAPVYELPTAEDADPRATFRGSLEIWGWLIGIVPAIYVVGLPITLTAFVFLYVIAYGGSWRVGAVLAALVAGFIFGIYEQIMHVYWPESYLGALLSWAS